MPEYLIAFDQSWVPDWPEEAFLERKTLLQPLLAEMRAEGVLVFTGGLDDEAPIFSVEPVDGAPMFTDGPYVESKEHLGGFAVIDVADEQEARHWAGKIAVACGWPQEVHSFRVPKNRAS